MNAPRSSGVDRASMTDAEISPSCICTDAFDDDALEEHHCWSRILAADISGCRLSSCVCSNLFDAVTLELEISHSKRGYIRVVYRCLMCQHDVI